MPPYFKIESNASFGTTQSRLSTFSSWSGRTVSQGTLNLDHHYMNVLKKLLYPAGLVIMSPICPCHFTAFDKTYRAGRRSSKIIGYL
jgi:hypothetical protein